MEVWLVYWNEADEGEIGEAVVELYVERDQGRKRLADFIAGSFGLPDDIVAKLMFTEDSVAWNLLDEESIERQQGALMLLEVRGTPDELAARREHPAGKGAEEGPSHEDV